MAALFTVRSCAIWKIQTSFAPPARVTPAFVIKTPVLHLYRPGGSVCPLISPAYNSVAVGFVLPAASVNAVSMSLTAVVSIELVGVVISAPYKNPVTRGDVADVVPTFVNEKPVK